MAMINKKKRINKLNKRIRKGALKVSYTSGKNTLILSFRNGGVYCSNLSDVTCVKILFAWRLANIVSKFKWEGVNLHKIFKKRTTFALFLKNEYLKQMI